MALTAPTGAQLGRYEIVKYLASGLMAELLLARARGLEGFERHFVIKRIRAEQERDEAFIEMFITEARLAAALHHHNIVQVHDIGEDDGKPYFAMEYVHGEDLRRVLGRLFDLGQHMPLEHVIAIVSSVAGALHHAHEAVGPDRVSLGIVHRDVTPANILLGYDGNVKVVDFGIARAVMRRTETQAGMLVGKAPYMAPEQCVGGGIDRRSDVFALGIVLFELITGRRLFKGDNEFLTMSAVVEANVPKPSLHREGVPAALDAIVLRALSRDPAARFQSAEQMFFALDQVATNEGLRSSGLGLAAFMKDVFGHRVEPWLGNDDRPRSTSPEFDGVLPGLAAPPMGSAETYTLPPTKSLKPSPIAQARSNAISDQPATTPLTVASAAVPQVVGEQRSKGVRIPEASGGTPRAPRDKAAFRTTQVPVAPMPGRPRPKTKTVQIPLTKSTESLEDAPTRTEVLSDVDVDMLEVPVEAKTASATNGSSAAKTSQPAPKPASKPASAAATSKPASTAAPPASKPASTEKPKPATAASIPTSTSATTTVAAKPVSTAEPAPTGEPKPSARPSSGLSVTAFSQAAKGSPSPTPTTKVPPIAKPASETPAPEDVPTRKTPLPIAAATPSAPKRNTPPPMQALSTATEAPRHNTPPPMPALTPSPPTLASSSQAMAPMVEGSQTNATALDTRESRKLPLPDVEPMTEIDPLSTRTGEVAIGSPSKWQNPEPFDPDEPSIVVRSNSLIMAEVAAEEAARTLAEDVAKTQATHVARSRADSEAPTFAEQTEIDDGPTGVLPEDGPTNVLPEDGPTTVRRDPSVHEAPTYVMRDGGRNGPSNQPLSNGPSSNPPSTMPPGWTPPARPTRLGPPERGSQDRITPLPPPPLMPEITDYPRLRTDSVLPMAAPASSAPMPGWMPAAPTVDAKPMSSRKKRLIGAGAGALLLIVIIAIATRGGDDAPKPQTAAHDPETTAPEPTVKAPEGAAGSVTPDPPPPVAPSEPTEPTEPTTTGTAGKTETPPVPPPPSPDKTVRPPKKPVKAPAKVASKPPKKVVAKPPVKKPPVKKPPVKKPPPKPPGWDPNSLFPKKK